MKKLAMGLVGALALAMVLSGSTMGDQSLPAEWEGEFVSVDNPFVCSAPSTAEALLADPTTAIPATCDNGEFVRTGFSMTHGFTGTPYASEGWTGHFESWLIHDGDDRGFRCTFDAGTLVACEGLGGSFPASGSTFTHECRAFESDTGLELPIAHHAWSCVVFGNIVEA